MEPIKGTLVTLIGHDTLVGYLTGRTKPGRRCEYWQIYWTKTDADMADNIGQWVPRDQIIRR